MAAKAMTYFKKCFFKDDDRSRCTDDDEWLSREKSIENTTDGRTQKHLADTHILVSL